MDDDVKKEMQYLHDRICLIEQYIEKLDMKNWEYMDDLEKLIKEGKCHG